MKQVTLRIGIDMTGLWRQSTGIFRYTAELVKHLLVLPASQMQTEVHYILFFAGEIYPDFQPLQHTFEAVICPTQNELLSKQIWFPLVLPHYRLDVMHYPTFPPPFFQPARPPMIMTFYDAVPWRYAHTQTWQGNLYFRTLLQRGVRQCKRIVTLSSHARSEIAHFIGKQYVARVAIAPGAVGPEFAILVGAEVQQDVRQRYQLPAQYFLTVATIEPRKNLSRLLEAYEQLRQQLGASCPALIIVGRKGWNCEDILRHMDTLRDCVHFLNHVPDHDLIALYQMAYCFVFPSLYEGFGLPVLEAMAAGCPVITTTSSALPEVAGDAALLVDPLDASAMAGAMEQVYRDQGLRRRMIADGCIQAACFSWERTAHVYRDIYLATRQIAPEKVCVD